MAQEALVKRRVHKPSNVREIPLEKRAFLQRFYYECLYMYFAIPLPKPAAKKRDVLPKTTQEKLEVSQKKRAEYDGYVLGYEKRIELLDAFLKHAIHLGLFMDLEDIFVQAPLFGGKREKVSEQILFDQRAQEYCRRKAKKFEGQVARLEEKLGREVEEFLFLAQSGIR